MTIGGLLKHMAYVEDNWFSMFLHGHADLIRESLDGQVGE